MVQLNRDSLSKLKSKLKVPTFPQNQEDSTAKIWLHVGLGAFHRSHQALCMQRILHKNPQNPWRLIGTSLRPNDTPLLKKLNAQDNHYTLIEYGGKGDPRCEVIGVHQEIFSSCDNTPYFINLFKSPQCSFVTFTVTEGGYYLIESEGSLLLNHPNIQNDLDSTRPPITLYGFLCKGLKARFQAGGAPLTLLSCDNVIGNGNVLRTGLMAFLKANHESSKLLDWIERSVAFPNCMVDRITPGYTPHLTDVIEKLYQYTDQVPVQAESFWQWVVEDNFSSDRPPIEYGGAELVSDVTPYEEMKLRILNAGHSSLTYRGMLLGYKTYDQVIGAPEQRKFYDQYQATEVLPQLKHLQALGPEKYLAATVERFSNTQIQDTLARIGCDGMAKVPKFVLPTLRANLKTNGPIIHAVEIIVNWSGVVKSHLEGNLPEYRDGEIKTLKGFIEKAGLEKGLLFNPLLWGEDVIAHKRYQQQIAHSLQHGISEKGSILNANKGTKHIL